jgi:hypothetical protein
VSQIFITLLISRIRIILPLLIPDPDPQQYLSGCAVPCLSFQTEIRHADKF